MTWRRASRDGSGCNSNAREERAPQPRPLCGRTLPSGRAAHAQRCDSSRADKMRRTPKRSSSFPLTFFECSLRLRTPPFLLGNSSDTGLLATGTRANTTSCLFCVCFARLDGGAVLTPNVSYSERCVAHAFVLRRFRYRAEYRGGRVRVPIPAASALAETNAVLFQHRASSSSGLCFSYISYPFSAPLMLCACPVHVAHC